MTASPSLFPDRLIDARTVARRLGIATRTLWKHIANGLAPPPVVKGIGRRTLWRESDVNQHIAGLVPLT